MHLTEYFTCTWYKNVSPHSPALSPNQALQSWRVSFELVWLRGALWPHLYLMHSVPSPAGAAAEGSAVVEGHGRPQLRQSRLLSEMTPSRRQGAAQVWAAMPAEALLTSFCSCVIRAFRNFCSG